MASDHVHRFLNQNRYRNASVDAKIMFYTRQILKVRFAFLRNRKKRYSTLDHNI